VLDINKNSLIAHNYSYDAFGNEKDKNTNDTNPFRYCGEMFDKETTTYYLRARYYAPRTGRFITEDPIRSGLNWYTYCGNNPVMFVDPQGLVSVNLVDYSRAMGADINEFTRNGNSMATINYNETKVTYKLNNGVMDDTDINERFGFSSFLTDQDREAEVGIVIMDGKLYYDVTSPMTKLFHNAKDLAKDKRWALNKMFWFKEQVDHKADWDIKRSAPWEKSVGTTYPGAHDAQVYFNGEYITPETLGNLLYGYAGSAAWISEDMLILGSLYAAGWNFDDNEKGDHVVIRRGIEMYNNGF